MRNLALIVPTPFSVPSSIYTTKPSQCQWDPFFSTTDLSSALNKLGYNSITDQVANLCAKNITYIGEQFRNITVMMIRPSNGAGPSNEQNHTEGRDGDGFGPVPLAARYTVRYPTATPRDLLTGDDPQSTQYVEDLFEEELDCNDGDPILEVGCQELPTNRAANNITRSVGTAAISTFVFSLITGGTHLMAAAIAAGAKELFKQQYGAYLWNEAYSIGLGLAAAAGRVIDRFRTQQDLSPAQTLWNAFLLAHQQNGTFNIDQFTQAVGEIDHTLPLDVDVEVNITENLVNYDTADADLELPVGGDLVVEEAADEVTNLSFLRELIELLSEHPSLRSRAHSFLQLARLPFNRGRPIINAVAIAGLIEQLDVRDTFWTIPRINLLFELSRPSEQDLSRRRELRRAVRDVYTNVLAREEGDSLPNRDPRTNLFRMIIPEPRQVVVEEPVELQTGILGIFASTIGYVAEPNRTVRQESGERVLLDALRAPIFAQVLPFMSEEQIRQLTAFFKTNEGQEYMRSTLQNLVSQINPNDENNRQYHLAIFSLLRAFKLLNLDGQYKIIRQWLTAIMGDEANRDSLLIELYHNPQPLIIRAMLEDIAHVKHRRELKTTNITEDELLLLKKALKPK